MQCACAILSPAACTALQNIFPYFKKKKSTIFREKVIEQKTRVLIFQKKKNSS